MLLRVAGLLLIAVSLEGQAQERALHTPVRGGGTLRLTAVHVTPGSVRLDGRPDEAAWQAANWVTEFVTKDPVEGGVPSERTAVALVYDDAALYVGARLWTSDPSQVRALVSRRDEDIGSADMLVISLDTFRDRITAYTLAVTAAGGRHDWFHPMDNEYNWDLSWDPVWEARTQRDSLGWYAEMRIPFDQLRFNDIDEQVWGLNINRWIPARNEDIFWTYVPKNETGWSSWLPALEGIRGIRPSRRIELLPYVASGATLTGERVAADPFDDGFREQARVGANLKMGLGPNLTLDAAINPDFGQVEADPAVVNLTAFETFFAERRPFFTEGAQLLQGGGRGYFYSRRIGAAPFGPARGDFVDRPVASTILGAAKVTGRLGSGLSLGALGALTDEETARTFDGGTGAFGSARVAPRTGYGLVRLQQEFGSGSTGGFVLTGVRRDVAAGDGLAELVAREAYTGGTDWRLRLAGGRWVIRGNAGFSHLAGEPGAILRQQLSPRRYFQRPDADYVAVDSTRTTMTGFAGSVGVEKATGRLLFEAQLSAESPEFELNDLGQLGNTDDLSAFGIVRWRQTQPGPLFRSWSLFGVSFGNWNFGGVRNSLGFEAGASAQLPNFWQVGISAAHNLGGMSDASTRGGPLLRAGANWSGGLNVQTNFAARTQWGLSVFGFRSATGSRVASVSASLQLKPSSRLTVSLEPGYDRLIEARQYVATRPGGPAATFGSRYIYAYAHRSQLSAQARVNYAITPDLTLEFYAEPFAASVEYRDIGELVRAADNALRAYGTDGTTITRDADGDYTVADATTGDTFGFGNPDFTFRSFRSNLVLRWEWRPGSTLFMVWQQNRGARAPVDGFVGPGDLWDALGATGDNFLAVKVSYWIG